MTGSILIPNIRPHQGRKYDDEAIVETPLVHRYKKMHSFWKAAQNAVQVRELDFLSPLLKRDLSSSSISIIDSCSNISETELMWVKCMTQVTCVDGIFSTCVCNHNNHVLALWHSLAQNVTLWRFILLPFSITRKMWVFWLFE